MNKEKGVFLVAISILVGTCIGAGFLGIPYVASKVGFFPAIGYIILLGIVILLVNLYLGEISLRTKGDYQIPGYAKKYLGKTGITLSKFATIFVIYSAVIAYMLGIGESISFLIFSNSNYVILFGVFVGLFMSTFLWKGLPVLKKFEKIGVGIILALLVLIFIIFIKDVNTINLLTFNLSSIFLPFGVVLFALLSFHAIPEVRLVLHNNEKKMKKVLIASVLVVVLFYSLFTFLIVGSQGANTPEIATLALGSIFIILGIFAMFTSYLALGNALIQDFMFDNNFKKRKAWFLTSIIPILIFVFIKLVASEFFSFTKVLSIGGSVSGALIGILVLFMIKKAKQKGDRKPEYSIPLNWFIIGLLILVFATGIIFEVINAF